MVDRANTVSLGDGNLNISAKTPVGTPRIADEPVLKAAGLVETVTNNRDGVVGFDAASGVIEDAAGIVVEDWLTSGNGDGNWLSCNGNFHGSGSLGIHANIGRKLDLGSLGLIVGASAINGKVRPVRVKVSIVGN